MTDPKDKRVGEGTTTLDYLFAVYPWLKDHIENEKEDAYHQGVEDGITREREKLECPEDL